MIVLFTDFGVGGPYTGQMIAVLRRLAPDTDVVELMADAPAHDPRAAAYLLAAYTAEFPPDTVFLCVVDPGVGGDRAAGVLWADDRWFVGPDNGLFEPLMRRAQAARWHRITWRPARLSRTFHGRDLFAPVAAALATGQKVEMEERPMTEASRPDWPDDLPEVVYIDAFGNAMTGIRAGAITANARIAIGGVPIPRAETFADVSIGMAFCYENANGLLEVAVREGRADVALGLNVGSTITIDRV
jgi:S-adenosyl-L-methionine hydrolase (adenosine-forming)